MRLCFRVWKGVWPHAMVRFSSTYERTISQGRRTCSRHSTLATGTLRIVDLCPHDFEEFCRAKEVGSEALDHVRECFAHGKSVLSAAHERLMTPFHRSLMVGSMLGRWISSLGEVAAWCDFFRSSQESPIRDTVP